MNTVINQLSEIEKSADSIMDDANAGKKALAQEMEEKTAAFDAALEAETAKKIAQIHEQMDAELKELLDKQTKESAALIKQLEANYENCHAAYAETLFRSMVKE